MFAHASVPTSAVSTWCVGMTTVNIARTLVDFLKKIECKKVHITYQFEFWFDYWTFILTEALCSITMETILTRTDVSTNSVIACGIHVTIMLVRITFVNVLKIINRKQNLIYQNSISFRRFCSIIFIMQQNVHTYRSTVCHFHGNHLYTCRCVHQ